MLKNHASSLKFDKLFMRMFVSGLKKVGGQQLLKIVLHSTKSDWVTCQGFIVFNNVVGMYNIKSWPIKI